MITIGSGLIEAISKWASKDETRPHLQVVAFTNGEIVATDGHRMVCVPCPEAPRSGAGFGVFAMHLQAAVAAQRCLKPQHQTLVIDRLDANVVRIGIGHKNMRPCESSLSFVPEDLGRFPHYARVFPAEGVPDTGLKGIAMNPEYLATIGEVSRAQGCNNIQVVGWTNNPRDPVLFKNEAGSRFVVMPVVIRKGEPDVG